TTAKVLVPNKFWILENDGEKFATLSKDKKGYSILCRGQKIEMHNLTEIKERFGITITEDAVKKEKQSKDTTTTDIYGFPVNGRAFEPLWNVQKRLPIYAKSSKSKSLYCAGYYVIQFRKGWVKSFCPKLITLERYPFKGPFKTEIEMRSVLNSVSKDL
ncbi:MAG: hypothetical protein WCK82_13830, partial [Bacteroidota bacterium]